MKCDKAQEFFSDYIENTLDRPMVVAVETHLSGCEACSADVASLRDMWTVLDKVPAVEPPADFVWRTTTRLQNELLNRREAERARPLPWWKRLTPAQSFSYAGVAALLLVGVVFQAGNKINYGAWGWNWPFGVHQQFGDPVPHHPMSAPQFVVQLPAVSGAAPVVTVKAISPMPYATVAVAPLTPMGQRLVGNSAQARAAQSLTAGQSFALPIQTDGAAAVRIDVQSMGKTFSKILILPGAPAVAGPIQTDDPYFALEQIANRSGQAMLADAGWKQALTLNLQGVDPQQAVQNLLSQLNAKPSTEPSGVVDLTR